MAHPTRSSRTRQQTCCGDHHIHVRARFARQIYEALRAMAETGEVTRIRERHTAISWQANQPARFVDELEVCLAMPPMLPDRDRQIGAD